MSDMSVGSITTKGQVTIPKNVRKKLDLKEGDRIVFTIIGDQATLKKISGQKLSEILQKQGPWKEHSLKLQKRIRREWQ
jgi:AbrB family looped-hinge helix DNA binding protein